MDPSVRFEGTVVEKSLGHSGTRNLGALNHLYYMGFLIISIVV